METVVAERKALKKKHVLQCEARDVHKRSETNQQHEHHT